MSKVVERLSAFGWWLAGPTMTRTTAPITLRIRVDTKPFADAIRRIQLDFDRLGAAVRATSEQWVSFDRAHREALHNEFPLLYGRPE